jgi:hypothetical protein
MTSGIVSTPMPDWQQVSVQQFFAQLRWQPPAPPKAAAAIAPAITDATDTTIVEFAAATPKLTLSMPVNAYFRNFDWRGQPQVSRRASSRPPAEALLDLDLLDNVFQAEGKDANVSIGDFSDFF